MSTSHQRKRPAFSLVELLVVIGIIAVLIALLLPSLGRARYEARRVACMSNLRQIGQAFMMYASENKGAFPRTYYLTNFTWTHSPDSFCGLRGSRTPRLPLRF